MRAHWPAAAIAVLLVLGVGCSSSSGDDSGAGGGSAGGGGGGTEIGPDCTTSADCPELGFDVCRQSHCAKNVACADDVECGLGEQCQQQACHFTGCVTDDDCGSGKCRTDVFECAECGANDDCPSDRPVCDTTANRCVHCAHDSDCAMPGPAYCDTGSGGCVHCLTSDQCENGLTCAADHTCQGTMLGGACPTGVVCGEGLTCVTINQQQTCLQACNLYSPTCPSAQICFKLTFSNTNSLVFDTDGPLGVCFDKPAGLKDYQQPCTRTGATSNCEPNLVCVPEDAHDSLCRTFCDPNGTNVCPSGESCHTFPGDFTGRLYGLCYPNNGWGDTCHHDVDCRDGLACSPYDDPSATNSLSPICQFDVGDAGALEPCNALPLPDGGLTNPALDCRSGACVSDPLTAAPPSYCYAACTSDKDCTVNGHTGICDAQYAFLTSTGTVGSVLGCRLGCDSNVDCSAYPNVHQCHGLLVQGFTPSYTQTCELEAGTGKPGSACDNDLDCQSGTCLTLDARGVMRQGYCAQPCTQANDCATASDAGSLGTVGCTPLTLLGFEGFDGVPGTPDDTLYTTQLCSSLGCTTDADCGGGVCVPDVDPNQPGNAFVKVCRPLTQNGTLQAGAGCTYDDECLSGVCGQLVPPSVGSGKSCLEACDGTTVCPSGTQCRSQGMAVFTWFASQMLDTCAP